MNLRSAAFQSMRGRTSSAAIPASHPGRVPAPRALAAPIACATRACQSARIASPSDSDPIGAESIIPPHWPGSEERPGRSAGALPAPAAPGPAEPLPWLPWPLGAPLGGGALPLPDPLPGVPPCGDPLPGSAEPPCDGGALPPCGFPWLGGGGGVLAACCAERLAYMSSAPSPSYSADSSAPAGSRRPAARTSGLIA